MPNFEWEQRPSRHFGDVWVPKATIKLRSHEGRFRKFSMQVDTGAVISLLRRSSVDMLGIPLEVGRRIDLGSVAGGTIFAYVHDLTVRFGSTAAITAPFAIAETDTVPNLLGRLGILDRFRFILDPTRHRTEVSGPLTSEGTA